MSEPIVTVGIDLGTTNSVVAYWDGKQPRVCGFRESGGLVPSVFSWQPPGPAGGPGTYLIGRPALNNWKAAPQHTVLCVKRLMGRRFDEDEVRETRERFHYKVVADENQQVAVEVGGRRFSPVDVSAHYLQLLRDRAERELRRKVTAAVITVPAYFEERQREATRQAGEKAGLLVKKIIDEPTAAAIAFGLTAAEGRHQLLVFDLGGGTFDISILQFARNQRTGEPVFEVQEIDGDNWLGGSDMDYRIVEHVVDDFSSKHQIDPRHDREFMAALRQKAEQVKILLSDTEEVRIVLPAAYRNEGKVLGIDLPLKRERYEALVNAEFDKAMAAVRRALDSRSLRTQDVTAVLLVGGTTKTPLVRKRLADLFGQEKIATGVDPMTSVALGAAILAGKLKGIECPNAQCGEAQQVKDHRTNRTVTVFRRHVNDEARTTCDKCNTPLAAGRAMVEGLQYSEPTAFSLGILAVRGDQQNAYVSLIDKGTHYPLPQPVVRTFHPTASNTRKLRVPVFEAIDNRGAQRRLQGDILYELGETITGNTPVEVSFNLDRNRVVSVTIRVKDSSIPPREARLELSELPTAQAGSPARKVSWDQHLENLMRHTTNLFRRYEAYLEPPGLRAQKVADDLRRAEQALDSADRTQAPTPEVQKVLGILENDLMESGVGTQLYLADLALEDVTDSALAGQVRAAQADLKDAFTGGTPARKSICLAALRSLLAKVWGSKDRSHPADEEHRFNPAELLRAD